MHIFSAVYQVPTSMRLLAAVGAIVSAVSLPILVGIGAFFQVMLVAAAGIFAASIALFGRKTKVA